jgi:NADH dehydrogenase
MSAEPHALKRSVNTPPHVVIIGAGFGGLEAAKALARAPVRVTVLDKSNHHLFQPLLYQVATAGLSPADIAMPIRGLLGRFRNTRVLMAEAERIDADQRRVRLKDGHDLDYDYLVVAAGARTNYFGNDDWAEHSVGLKSVEDALEIRRRVLTAFEQAEREEDEAERRRLLTFVVIGAGPTGVELAGAISELNRRVLAADYRRVRSEEVRVILLDMAPRVLAGMHESLSESAEKQLESLHVEVHLGAAVKSIEAGRVVTDQESFDSRTVMWTAGVSPVPLGGTIGVELVKGKVPVQEDCSVEGHPELFVIGDLAHFVGDDGQPLPGVSPVAMQQGRFVAAAIQADLDGLHRGKFRYVDKGMMATVGRSRAVADVRGVRFDGFTAWLAWLAVHLFFLVGFKNRVAVLFNWIWQYVAYRRGARLITYTEPVGPRQAAALPEPREAADTEVAATEHPATAAR